METVSGFGPAELRGLGLHGCRFSGFGSQGVRV